MNIDWVIPCRYVEVHDNLGTIVGAGIDTFWVPEIPRPIQVILAIPLTGMADELSPDVAHQVKNVVRDPRGEVLSEIAGEVRVSSGEEEARHDWLTGIMVSSVVQFEAAEEGSYTIEHVVDDASSSLPIHVILGLPPGISPPE